MSAAAANQGLGDQVMQNIRGMSAAQKLVFEIREGRASPDAVLDAIRAAGDGYRLRGLARELQKTIERGPA